MEWGLRRLAVFALAVPARKGARGREARCPRRVSATPRTLRQRIAASALSRQLAPTRLRRLARQQSGGSPFRRFPTDAEAWPRRRWGRPPAGLPAYPLACPDRPLARALAPRPMWADAAAERPAYRFRQRQDKEAVPAPAPGRA